jgi:ribosomal protein S15P/S13E
LRLTGITSTRENGGAGEMKKQKASEDQEPTQALAVRDGEKDEKIMELAQAIAFIQKHLNDKQLDTASRAKLELALRQNPNLWRAVGDLAVQTQNNMVEKMTSQAVVEVAMKHGLGRMRAELGEGDAPMLEKLLIDGVILSWLNLNAVQRAYDHNMIGGVAVTLTSGMYWEKRLTMAQARYAKAIETLARVRKLSSVTPLQVNIGGQQINVAGAVASPKNDVGG